MRLPVAHRNRRAWGRITHLPTQYPVRTATSHGTMFIGSSCDQHLLTRMLARMEGAEDGIRDALSRYTTVVSAAYYGRTFGRGTPEVCFNRRLTNWGLAH